MLLCREVRLFTSAIEVRRRIFTSTLSCFNLSRSSVRASLPLKATVHSVVPSGLGFDWKRQVRQKAFDRMTIPQKTDSVSREPTILPLLVSTIYASLTRGLDLTSFTTSFNSSGLELTSTSWRIPSFDSAG